MTATVQDDAHAGPREQTRVLVAALGDTEHGDEGFAAHVLRALPVDRLPPGVSVAYYGTSGERLLEDLRGGRWDALVVLDALPERGCPGSLRVVDVDARRAVTVSHDLDAPRSSGAASLTSAAQALVPRTVLVGCEVVAADERVGLTGDVEACVRPAARFVLSVLSRLTGLPVREPRWLSDEDADVPDDVPDDAVDRVLQRAPLGRVGSRG
jgi:hydrogenase maturation protease